MSKTLTYTGFAISGLIVVLAFVTAKTYTQLIIAILVFPFLAYFLLKILPRRTRKAPIFTIQMPARPAHKAEKAERPKVDVADIDKRIFLKLVGTAGISFFILSIFGRRVEALLFGGASEPGVSSLAGTPNNQINSAGQLPVEGFKISEIDDDIISYYGFTDKDGAWLIMREDTEANSFRYARGDSRFSGSWSNRENLKYDYFHNLF